MSEVIDAAFVNSDTNTLGDLKLHGWSPERMLHAQSLGMKYPALSESDWAQYRQTKIYPGCPKDVILFVYLSVLPDEDERDAKGKLITPSFSYATYKEAQAFGIKRKLHLTNEQPFWDAHLAFVQANNEIAASTTIPKIRGDEETEDDP